VSDSFDVVIAGGSIAGSSAAIALSELGLRVALLERGGTFRDRVRGEGIHPWGMAEAEELGLLPALAEAGAHPLPIWQRYDERAPLEPYAWAEDSVGGHVEHGVFHPRLQATLLDWAAARGVAIHRAAALLTFRGEGDDIAVAVAEGATGGLELRCRLLVGADERAIPERRKLSFAGIVSVAIAIDERGEVAGDPVIDLMGVPNATRRGGA
jgi:2-polyprenyl-6-methoxyphenol hydroxylase-like FAD-dependent oxidoreductase